MENGLSEPWTPRLVRRTGDSASHTPLPSSHVFLGPFSTFATVTAGPELSLSRVFSLLVAADPAICWMVLQRMGKQLLQ